VDRREKQISGCSTYQDLALSTDDDKASLNAEEGRR
jgi:hypothetical protein